MNMDEKTQGHKKVVNHLRDIIKTTKFQQEVQILRKKYFIPENGYQLTQAHLDDPWNLTSPPIEWDEMIEREKVTNASNRLEEDADDLCARFGVYSRTYPNPIEVYLMYNHLHFFGEEFIAFNVCALDDVESRNSREEKGYVHSEDMREYYKKESIELDKFFPVFLRISPNASLRDILDFVRAGYWEIKGRQMRYATTTIKIGDSKTKDPEIQKRNDFIFENRNLPRKEIMKLVNKQFPDLSDFPDPGTIAKIISTERKRRESVIQMMSSEAQNDLI